MINTAEHSGIYVELEQLLGLRAMAQDFNLKPRKSGRSISDGLARSTRRGRGMEFAEVRHYQAGDDVRNIDWRVTARTQTTHTKLFHEEKERPVYLLIDQRASLFFGSVRSFKSVLAAELAAIIAWCAVRDGDRLGGLIFSDREQADFRAQRGRAAVFTLLRNLATFNQKLRSPITAGHHGENLSLAALSQELLRVARPGSLVYVVSDFVDFDASCRKTMTLLRRHCELELLHIYDPLEVQLPAGGVLPLSDGTQRILINAEHQDTRESFTRAWQDTQLRIKSAAHGLKAGYTLLSCAEPLRDTALTCLQLAKSRSRS